MRWPFHLPCLWVALACLGAVGCASPQPVTPSERLVAASDYDAVYDAAEAVLRDRGFKRDRRDYRFGVVQSRPQGAATLAEVWRPNNVTLGAALDSTLNDHRRTVTVTLEPLDASEPVLELLSALDPESPPESPPEVPSEARESAQELDVATQGTSPAAAYRLGVEVQIERRQSPNRRVGGGVRGQVFTSLTRTPIELQRRGIPGDYWQPIGRDPALEQQIAREILNRVVPQ